MDFFTLVQWGTVCKGWGVVWVIGWTMGVGVGGVNSFRPIYKGNPFIKFYKGNPLEIFFEQNFFSKKKKLRNFSIGKISDFFSKIFSKHVFITLVRGPKTTRKKY